MLIITRKLNQVLKVQVPELGQEAVVSVVKIDRGVIKLGITCPLHWNIRRGELDLPEAAPPPH